jgi:dCMP deaminase
MTRPSWSQHFMAVAELMATRATCDRLRVGAVFTRDNRILVTGYNGALPGRQHCDEIGHLMHEDHCVRTAHAEENAVAQASKHGVNLDKSILYVTHLPCLKCFKLCLAAGVSVVWYKEQYGTADLSIYRSLQGMTRLEQLT